MERKNRFFYLHYVGHENRRAIIITLLNTTYFTIKYFIIKDVTFKYML